MPVNGVDSRSLRSNCISKINKRFVGRSVDSADFKSDLEKTKSYQRSTDVIHSTVSFCMPRTVSTVFSFESQPCSLQSCMRMVIQRLI